MLHTTKEKKKEEIQRESRKHLSRTNAIPQWLLEKYAPPEWAHIHHTVHKDSTLPLFQAKLLNNETFAGKIPDFRTKHSRFPFFNNAVASVRFVSR